MTKELAELNGELTSFSFDIWRASSAKDVQLDVLGASNSRCRSGSWRSSSWLLLIAASSPAAKVPRYGGWIVGGSLVLLLLPFMTIPAGSNLLRIAEIQSEDSSYLRLFFKSVTLAMTTSVLAVLDGVPDRLLPRLLLTKSKYTWLIIVIAPFLTSYLLRIFAWKVILGDQGADQLRRSSPPGCAPTATRCRS